MRTKIVLLTLIVFIPQISLSQSMEDKIVQAKVCDRAQNYINDISALFSTTTSDSELETSSVSLRAKYTGMPGLDESGRKYYAEIYDAIATWSAALRIDRLKYDPMLEQYLSHLNRVSGSTSPPSQTEKLEAKIKSLCANITIPKIRKFKSD